MGAAASVRISILPPLYFSARTSTAFARPCWLSLELGFRFYPRQSKKGGGDADFCDDITKIFPSHVGHMSQPSGYSFCHSAAQDCRWRHFDMSGIRSRNGNKPNDILSFACPGTFDRGRWFNDGDGR